MKESDWYLIEDSYKFEPQFTNIFNTINSSLFTAMMLSSYLTDKTEIQFQNITHHALWSFEVGEASPFLFLLPSDKTTYFSPLISKYENSVIFKLVTFHNLKS